MLVLAPELAVATYVGSSIQHDWKGSSGVDASADRRQNQFRNGDEDATNPLITNSKDLFDCQHRSKRCNTSRIMYFFSIRNHNIINIFCFAKL